MYNYSPISEILIKNFRNLGQVKLDFHDSPIITLIGDNESGKTSIVKAIGVCAMNQGVRNQKDYIRDGTTGFGVAIELADKTQVIRIKTTTANQYKVVYPDGKEWIADKIDGRDQKPVQDVMGLIEEPETKELLQIRTYEDQLLFVVTPASTNYKVMYDALKISNLTKAIKLGSTEVNELNSVTRAVDNSIITLNSSLSKIRLFDIEPLMNIKNQLKESYKTLDLIDKASDLIENISKMKSNLGALALLDSEDVQLIDELEALKIESAGRLLESIDCEKMKLSKYGDLDALEEIDVSIIEKLENGVYELSEIEDAKNKNQAYLKLNEVEPVSEVIISLLDNSNVVMENLDKQTRLLEVYRADELEDIGDDILIGIENTEKALVCSEFIQNSSGELAQLVDYIDKVIAWMKSIGVATTDCPRCGESIIIDLDLVNGQ